MPALAKIKIVDSGGLTLFSGPKNGELQKALHKAETLLLRLEPVSKTEDSGKTQVFQLTGKKKDEEKALSNALTLPKRELDLLNLTANIGASSLTEQWRLIDAINFLRDENEKVHIRDIA